MLTQLPVDYERWEQRYKSLQLSNKIIRTQMVQWAKKQKPKPQANAACPPWVSYSRVKTFVSIMRSLAAFSDKQFQLLHGGFKDGKLEPAGNLPPDFVLRRFSDQDAHDVMLMQMAWHQRTSAEIDSECAQTLRLADKLAYAAVERAHAHDVLPDSSTAITYLQKAASARVVPYAPSAIIGIPYSSIAAYEDKSADTTVCVDLLAIPHEVGHYVYRHGRFEGSAISNRIINALVGSNAAMTGWAEEVFSDVYGTLIAGPVIALDFQDLMVDNNPVDLFHSDGEHPYAAVRPFIYIDTLLAMDKLLRDNDIDNPYSLRPAAFVLEARWRAILKERGYPYEKQANLQRERARVREVIRVAMADIVDLKKLDFSHLWSKGDSVKHELQKKLGGVPATFKKLMKELNGKSAEVRDQILKAEYVYTTFANWLKTTKLANPPDIVMADGQPKAIMSLCPNKTDIKWQPNDLIGLVKMWDFLTDQMLTAIEKDPRFKDETIPPNLWSQIAIQSGWIRTGPETSSDPKLGPETSSDPKLGPETSSDPKLD